MLCVFFAFSQKHDYIWTLGYGSNPIDTSFSGINFDFNQKPPQISKKYREMDFYGLSACISDTDGKLQFYSNGCYIANNQEQLMENGEHLNPGPIYDDWCHDGSDYLAGMQGMMILPYPDNTQVYSVFHKLTEIDIYPIAPVLYRTKVDMSYNNGLGKVVEKNIPVMEDTLATSELTAVRHVNGKDWWVITPQFNNDRYYIFLFTKDGIADTLEQQIGLARTVDSWQCIFSPDGTKFVRYGPVDDIYIFDFDRAAGQLSNFQFVPLQEETYQGSQPVTGGCMISPNSRYLYISSQFAVYQFDLWADDIKASQQVIGVYDDYFSPFATIFNTMQLGPDCKIYISIPNGVNVLHVINRPDEPGLACDLVQHGVSLPSYNAAMPLFPNYRLGAEPSYPCDSTLSVRVSAPLPTHGIMVVPNPASDWLRVQLPGPALRPAVFMLTAVSGAAARRAEIAPGADKVEIKLGDLPPGFYFWAVQSGERIAAQGKVVVVR